MRFEQIITAITCPVVIATVREIQAVVSFANDIRLHRWLLRMSLGMPAYSRPLFTLPHGDLDRWASDATGNRRGKMRLQPALVLASCSSGPRTA